MRGRDGLSTVPRFLLAILLLLVAVIYAGCGGGNSADYSEEVLEEWVKLEGNSEEMVQGAENISSEADFADFSDLLAEGRDIVDSFDDETDGPEVPADLEDSQQALEDFLAAYGAYLEAMQDWIDGVLGGVEPDRAPNLTTLAREAAEALEVYRDSQDYNPAELDPGIWDLPAILGEAMVEVLEIQGGEPADEKALETVDDWYAYFNRGDGDAMFALLDLASPILDTFPYESFMVQVGEAHGSGLQAEYTVEGSDSFSNDDGDWVEVSLRVDYSEYLDMEEQTVPAHSEDVLFELLNREDGWFVYQVISESSLW